MILEITYIYQESKSDSPQEGWTYFHSDNDDFQKSFKQATKHFTEWRKELGWGRQATLKSITLIKHEKTPPITRIIKPDPIRKRKSSRSTQKASLSSRKASS